MKMSMTGQMRMEQRMKLAPRMIQSMEVLQLPVLALLEKIEQELNNNPVLESNEPQAQETESAPVADDAGEIPAERTLVVSDDKNRQADFERLADADDEIQELFTRAGTFSRRVDTELSDRKQEAMQNTPQSGPSLYDYLMEQWRLIDATDAVKKAGRTIINFIDDRGYLTVRLEQLYNKDKKDYTLEDLQKALQLVQQLEPAGVGARDLKECLLIQLAQQSEDMSFEKRLIAEHLDKLLANQLPEIAKKMNCSIDRVKLAIEKMRKLDTSPGLLVSKDQNPPIMPDLIVEPDGQGGYEVHLADTSMPSLRLNGYYLKMARDRHLDDETRRFLQNNIRSAQWFMDAIEQRKNTMLRVARSIVEHQKEFFDKGQLYLRPLPMSVVAADVGVHVATVSRAVAGKYIQSPQGLLSLRSLFGGGTETPQGDSQSFDAIRANIQMIVDQEDKSAPLNDDQIRDKLRELGVGEIARRTVAKYRKIMNIPTARYRKKY